MFLSLRRDLYQLAVGFLEDSRPVPILSVSEKSIQEEFQLSSNATCCTLPPKRLHILSS